MKLSLMISLVFFMMLGFAGGNGFAGDLGAKSGTTVNTEIQSCDASRESCKPSQSSNEIAQIKIGEVLKFLDGQETDPNTWIQCTSDSACGSGHKCCSNHCKAVVTC